NIVGDLLAENIVGDLLAENIVGDLLAENIVGDLLERCCRGSQATGSGRPRALGPWTGTSWAHPGCLPRSGRAPPGRVAWRRRRLAWCSRAEQTRPAGMLPWHIPGDRRGPAWGPRAPR